jgi:hypothetical protein
LVSVIVLEILSPDSEFADGPIDLLVSCHALVA